MSAMAAAIAAPACQASMRECTDSAFWPHHLPLGAKFLFGRMACRVSGVIDLPDYPWPSYALIEHSDLLKSLDAYGILLTTPPAQTMIEASTQRDPAGRRQGSQACGRRRVPYANSFPHKGGYAHCYPSGPQLKRLISRSTGTCSFLNRSDSQNLWNWQSESRRWYDVLNSLLSALEATHRACM